MQYTTTRGIFATDIEWCSKNGL